MDPDGREGADGWPEEGLPPPPAGRLRRGFTTGACAAAAAKAAIHGLLGGEIPPAVEIFLPAGFPATFPVAAGELGEGFALAGVVKDAGDDPDVTHGVLVQVRAEPIPSGVVLAGGEGVGVVTKPGLGIPVGEPAINPVPRAMLSAVAEEGLARFGRDHGLRLTVAIPGGEALARRTLNPRLGIVGGLSVLGTTGVVEPYSPASYLASVAKGLDVARAMGRRAVVLATGRRSERFAEALLGLPEESYVEVADFMGFGLAEAAARNFAEVYVAVLVGKGAKLAQGDLDLHSRAGRADLAFLAELARQAGAGPAVAQAVAQATTARGALEVCRAAGIVGFPRRIAAAAHATCRRRLPAATALHLLLFDFDGTLLARHDDPRGG